MTTATAHPAQLDAAQLRDWLAADDGPRVLDVRSPGEFQTVHIPGSYNVPLDLLREHRHELRTHLEDQVVLVCRSGNRAQEAEKILASTGLPNLHVLNGGVTAWEQSGAQVNRGDGKWDLERQVRLVAGGLVVAGVLASIRLPQAKWLSGFIGAGLTTAALTNSCLMGQMLSKLPYNQDNSCDLQSVVAELRDA